MLHGCRREIALTIVTYFSKFHYQTFKRYTLTCCTDVNHGGEGLNRQSEKMCGLCDQIHVLENPFIALRRCGSIPACFTEWTSNLVVHYNPSWVAFRLLLSLPIMNCLYWPIQWHAWYRHVILGMSKKTVNHIVYYGSTFLPIRILSCVSY